MSRVLVVGMGVPGLVRAERHAGPGLRAAHLALALAQGGHRVLLVAVLDEGEPAPMALSPSPAIDVVFATECQFASPAVRARIASFAPDAVVGATVYASSLAARLGLDVPMWADVFGDVLAEAQAKAARTGSDWSIVHFWTLLRPVLERADRFSAVSRAQAHALVGQLGMAGRLSSRTAGEELVAVIPCSSESSPPLSEGEATALRRQTRAALGFGSDDFVLLASGSVNTWCDIETLVGGVAAAMKAEPRLGLVVTGGSIPGHDEMSYAALLQGLGVIDAARVRILGWIDSSRLAGLYAACDLGLHVERRLYERSLGAENRVVEWLAHGLPCVTTALSEAGGELVARGFARACEPASAASLERALRLALADRDATAKAGRAGAEWVARERTASATAAALVEWCASPRFAGDASGARLLRLGLLSQPSTSAEMLEAYVAELPVREVARRGLRWLWRRGSAALRRSLSRLFTFARAVRNGATMPCLLAALALFIPACDTVGTPPGSRRPNILLISVDTLRADHLGAYGYGVTPSPTPWMDWLATRGVLFEQSVSSAPETAPALASLLTGLYQDRHGVGYNRISLDEKMRPLAERLAEAGYATSAFVANRLVDAEHGFGQGFERTELVDSALPHSGTTDDRLVSRVGEMLRDPPKDRPWFVWVHMMDPHGPFDSAAPWWSSGHDYSQAAPSRDGEFPVSDSNFGLGVIPRYQVLDGAKRLFDYVRRYDGEVRFTDAQVGALLGMLAASGQAEDTIVVLTADHGESLDEHDELLQHGWFVYDATVRVPLIVSWPREFVEAKRVREQVCSVDVVPTLLELAGVGVETSDFDGRSFASLLGSGAAVGREPSARDCFSIGPRLNHPFALRAGGLKMILTPVNSPSDPKATKRPVDFVPERVELYDLAADPAETDNLAERRPDLLADLEQRLAAFRARFRANGWRW